MDELCNGDVNRPLLFEIWDWDRVGKHDLIGRFTVRRNIKETIQTRLIRDTDDCPHDSEWVH